MTIINNAPVSDAMVLQDGRPKLGWITWFSQVYAICFDVQNSGTTAQRPTKNLYIGKPYFDTTLGYGIKYNGTAWVRWDGTAV
jgi:hypothetical protein